MSTARSSTSSTWPTRRRRSPRPRKVRAGAPFKVAEVERKQVKRHPFPPFTTSTLQQEASRKLGFGASHTMRIAQRLYEGVDIDGETIGIITYMRTDGVTLAQDAIEASRKLIAEQYGKEFLPDSPRIYKSDREERAGSARSDPPDRPVPPARQDPPPSARRRGRAL